MNKNSYDNEDKKYILLKKKLKTSLKGSWERGGRGEGGKGAHNSSQSQYKLVNYSVTSFYVDRIVTSLERVKI